MGNTNTPPDKYTMEHICDADQIVGDWNHSKFCGLIEDFLSTFDHDEKKIGRLQDSLSHANNIWHLVALNNYILGRITFDQYRKTLQSERIGEIRRYVTSLRVFVGVWQQKLDMMLSSLEKMNSSNIYVSTLMKPQLAMTIAPSAPSENPKQNESAEGQTAVNVVVVVTPQLDTGCDKLEKESEFEILTRMMNNVADYARLEKLIVDHNLTKADQRKLKENLLKLVIDSKLQTGQLWLAQQLYSTLCSNMTK